MTTNEYNKCVDQYSDGIYRFILHNIRDKEEAQDIVQDTYEKMWINKDNVNPEKVKSYLFTTAYHTMINKIRRNKYKAPMTEVDFNKHYKEESYLGLKEILQEGLKRLPEIQRTVIMLRDYEGYDYREIGEITQLNESQVKVYIFRARQTLKEFIGSMRNVI